MKVWAFELLQAVTISSKLAVGHPRRMFSFIVQSNSLGSAMSGGAPAKRARKGLLVIVVGDLHEEHSDELKGASEANAEKTSP
jgi:hypothetical protein